MKIIISESQFNILAESKYKEAIIATIEELGVKKALEVLGITSHKLIEMGIIDLKKIVKELCDELLSGYYIDVEVEGEKIYIKMKGEKTYFYGDYLSKIKKELSSLYDFQANVKFKFEKDFTADVTYDKDGREYDVTLTKTLDDGSEFELTGRLVNYNSGRAMEYEFEPTDISDDDYYAENWEIIDEYILDNIPPLNKKTR